MYLASNTAFRFDRNGLPIGGFTWDGRANSRAEQAAGPLLDSTEMANADVAAVVQKVRALPYFNDFVSQFNVPAAPTDPQIFDKLQPAHGFHMNIGQNQVGLETIDKGQGCGAFSALFNSLNAQAAQ